jgi:hypothetical protein
LKTPDNRPELEGEWRGTHARAEESLEELVSW